LDEAFGQAQRLGGEPDAAGGRELLHARRLVRGLAHGGVVHAEIAADRAHDDVSGVDADADLHLQALRAAQLVRVAPHGLLHSERGIARPHGMVLVRHRRSERRHDAVVAHDLVHCALVAVDGLHHSREHRIEELARFFGVPVGEQLHRALQVGEEDRHLLALAFEGVLGGEDLLARCWGV
jgi:hypothetical protein